MSKKIKVLLIGVLIITLFICIMPFIINLSMTYIRINDFTNSIYVTGIDTDPYYLKKSSEPRILYYEVNDRNNIRKVNEFVPDDADIYTSTKCIEKNIINIGLSKCIIYKNDIEIEKKSEIIDIYNKVGESTNGHWIIEKEFKIFEIDSDYYVFAPLNVNMHTPVYFFRYNKESRNLEFLYQLENIDVTGIKVK